MTIRHSYSPDFGFRAHVHSSDLNTLNASNEFLIFK